MHSFWEQALFSPPPPFPMQDDEALQQRSREEIARLVALKAQLASGEERCGGC